MDFKQRTIERFPALFKEGEGEADYSARAQLASRYGWFSAVHRLAGGDITKQEQITRLPVSECLYTLSYITESAEVEAQEIKKMNKI